MVWWSPEPLWELKTPQSATKKLQATWEMPQDTFGDAQQTSNRFPRAFQDASRASQDAWDYSKILHAQSQNPESKIRTPEFPNFTIHSNILNPRSQILHPKLRNGKSKTPNFQIQNMQNRTSQIPNPRLQISKSPNSIQSNWSIPQPGMADCAERLNESLRAQLSQRDAWL